MVRIRTLRITYIVHIIVLYIAYNIITITCTFFKHTQLCGNIVHIIVLYIAYNINTITLFKHTQICVNIVHIIVLYITYNILLLLYSNIHNYVGI